MEEREAWRETVSRSLPTIQKTPLFDECAGVRRCDVIGGLWVSRRVGIQGFGTPGEEGGRKGPQMEEEGDPFFFPPALSCDHRSCGGSCTVCVSPRPGRPVEDRGGSSEASLDLLEGAQAFVWSHCWCLGSPGRQRSVAARPPPPHSSVTWRG